MKTFTKKEIELLELNLLAMKEGHAEVELEQLNQENLDELVLLFNMIVGEYAMLCGHEPRILEILELEKMTEEVLENILNILNEAAEGLVDVAKQNIEVN